MAFPEDPGRVFESDAHRRALGLAGKHDEAPIAFEELRLRFLEDGLLVAMVGGDTGKLASLLDELKQTGDLEPGNGYQQTKAGADRLNLALTEWDPETETYVEAGPLEGAAKEQALAESKRVTELQEARAAASRIASWEQAQRDAADQLKADRALVKKHERGEQLQEDAHAHIAERVEAR